jgi:hypothetical protein
MICSVDRVKQQQYLLGKHSSLDSPCCGRAWVLAAWPAARHGCIKGRGWICFAWRCCAQHHDTKKSDAALVVFCPIGRKDVHLQHHRGLPPGTVSNQLPVALPWPILVSKLQLHAAICLVHGLAYCSRGCMLLIQAH